MRFISLGSIDASRSGRLVSLPSFAGESLFCSRSLQANQAPMAVQVDRPTGGGGPGLLAKARACHAEIQSQAR